MRAARCSQVAVGASTVPARVAPLCELEATLLPRPPAAFPAHTWPNLFNPTTPPTLLALDRQSQFAAELVAPGALALGRQLIACPVDCPLHLVLACGGGADGAQGGEPPPQASAGTRAVRLGLLLLGAIFEHQPEARDEVLRSCQVDTNGGGGQKAGGASLLIRHLCDWGTGHARRGARHKSNASPYLDLFLCCPSTPPISWAPPAWRPACPRCCCSPACAVASPAYWQATCSPSRTASPTSRGCRQRLRWRCCARCGRFVARGVSCRTTVGALAKSARGGGETPATARQRCLVGVNVTARRASLPSTESHSPTTPFHPSDHAAAQGHVWPGPQQQVMKKTRGLGD
jgi:hypothetical protein